MMKNLVNNLTAETEVTETQNSMKVYTSMVLSGVAIALILLGVSELVEFITG